MSIRTDNPNFLDPQRWNDDSEFPPASPDFILTLANLYWAKIAPQVLQEDDRVSKQLRRGSKEGIESSLDWLKERKFATSIARRGKGLTHAGLAFAANYLRGDNRRWLPISFKDKDALPLAILYAHWNLTPSWSAGRRTLRVGWMLIKTLLLHAGNQDQILTAFEEDGWPSRVDDPLPGSTNVERKSRLRDAIKRLNQGHRNVLIRFRGDGTGNGVVWSYDPSLTDIALMGEIRNGTSDI